VYRSSAQWIRMVQEASDSAAVGRRRCYHRRMIVLPVANGGATAVLHDPVKDVTCGRLWCCQPVGQRCYHHPRCCYHRSLVLLLVLNGVAPSGIPWCCSHRRWSCHQTSVLLPAVYGGATSGARGCSQLVLRMLPAAACHAVSPLVVVLPTKKA
jgi:hypothetical protein